MLETVHNRFCFSNSKYSVALKCSKTSHTGRNFNLTLEFVCCSYDSEYIHVDLSIVGVLFSHPPPHSEEEVAWGEAVSTERVTERVLRSITQLKASGGVAEGLRDQQEMHTGVRLEQFRYNSDDEALTRAKMCTVIYSENYSRASWRLTLFKSKSNMSIIV